MYGLDLPTINFIAVVVMPLKSNVSITSRDVVRIAELPEARPAIYPAPAKPMV